MILRWLTFVAFCLFTIQNVDAGSGRWDVSLDQLQISNKPLKIGVITGVTWEAEELLKQFKPGYETIHSSRRDYYHGSLWGVDTVLVSSRCGKVAAAIAATTLILEHHVDLIVVVGTAGAVADALHIGDVIVASLLLQHDVDGRPIIPRYTIPILRVRELEPNLALQQIAIRASEIFVQAGFTKCISPDLIAEFGLESPNVHNGLVASGDQFIAQSARRAELKAELPSLLCVEMEGAAVGQVCYEFDVPLVVIRVLSDGAKEQAEVDCFKFVKSAAGIYSSEIVKNFYYGLQAAIAP